MKRPPQHIPVKMVKFILTLGVLLPFLIASFTSQLICANRAEMLLAFCAIFLFSFLAYWITLRVVTQWLDE